MMRIVADENVARVQDAFDGLGTFVAKPGRAITADDVRQADALLTRSITRVGPALLDGASVRFVGSATIGTDHVDIDYLRRRNIRFTSAPGSTAPPVAEWWAAAVLVLAHRRGWRLAEKTVGIVGLGNVGSRVARFADALGMRVIRNDPPLARTTGDPMYQPVEALAEADIVTVHTPLSRNGPDATYHLVDADWIARLKPGVVIVNTARGPIVDLRALADAIDRRHVSDALLDVWENEPQVDLDMMRRAAIATPHIAGHSYDGKVRGTEMIYRECCAHFGIEPTWDPWPTMPPSATARITVDAAGRHDEDVVRDVVLTANHIEADDRRFREVVERPTDEHAAYFDYLRASYPMHREFPSSRVMIRGGSATLQRTLSTLGFDVQEADGGFDSPVMSSRTGPASSSERIETP